MIATHGLTQEQWPDEDFGESWHPEAIHGFTWPLFVLHMFVLLREKLQILKKGSPSQWKYLRLGRV